MKKLSTSKKLIIFLFANCTLIELFVLFVTILSVMQVPITLVPADFSPLNTLVGAFVAETVAYAVYALKSMKENTEGGIVYESAMNEVSEDEEDDLEPEDSIRG